MAKKKLSIYTLIIKVLYFLLNMKMLELVFRNLNLRVLRNPIIL